MNAHTQQPPDGDVFPDAANSLADRIAADRPDDMSDDAFDAWINALPPDEFVALIAACAPNDLIDLAAGADELESPHAPEAPA